VCLDVDGVLTDGRLYIDDHGCGGRAFHVHDGLAIAAYRRLGGIPIICTGKHSNAVATRARELGIEHVIQASSHKRADLTPLLAKLELTFAQMAMVGDDLPDLSVLEVCGYPIAVANAAPEVKALARYVTQATGGHGAVREALEHLMRATGQWAQVLAHYRAAPPGAD
jgi:3-deoxy-D-manno-octulosonate 8-phosphate phosphatase (KDO 8-P phosphatase)